MLAEKPGEITHVQVQRLSDPFNGETLVEMLIDILPAPLDMEGWLFERKCSSWLKCQCVHRRMRCKCFARTEDHLLCSVSTDDQAKNTIFLLASVRFSANITKNNTEKTGKSPVFLGVFWPTRQNSNSRSSALLRV